MLGGPKGLQFFTRYFFFQPLSTSDILPSLSAKILVQSGVTARYYLDNTSPIAENNITPASEIPHWPLR